MLNQNMIDVIMGPFSAHVWILVYDMVDLLAGIGDMAKMDKRKSQLTKELVECVPWDQGLNAQWEASRLVQDLFGDAEAQSGFRGLSF